jgi:hypothetical protein
LLVQRESLYPSKEKLSLPKEKAETLIDATLYQDQEEKPEMAKLQILGPSYKHAWMEEAEQRILESMSCFYI